MKKIYEINTWKLDEQTQKLNAIAIAAAKNYNGKKYTVSIGEWNTTSYLVFADTKDEAKTMALEEFKNSGHKTTGQDRITARDVTESKKYK